MYDKIFRNECLDCQHAYNNERTATNKKNGYHGIVTQQFIEGDIALWNAYPFFQELVQIKQGAV